MLYSLKNLSRFSFILSVITGIWTLSDVALYFGRDPSGQEYALYTLPCAILGTILFVILGVALREIHSQLEAEKLATAQQIADLKKELAGK